jgi:peptidoglycan hydrolase-like protein with peptidoglycan-binding domain
MVKVVLVGLWAFVWAVVSPTVAGAQQLGWVQIEARPSEAQAAERAQDYARRLPNVNGFALPSGWYAIALGPYDRFTAEQELRRLLVDRAIPADSFVSDGRGFGRRIFGDGLTVQPEQVAVPVPQTLVPAEETLGQSRAAEGLLAREDRAEIQEALQWEGFYTGALDASFGPGTRRAMGDWQISRGYEPTGVLSTAQRDELIGEFREVLAGLGMRRVFDREAGIEIELPTALVDFARYEAPFAHYDAKDDSGVRVLLISQSGDQGTLFGLYDIMQTLEIVPLDGPRERRDRSFTITGANAEIVSTTYAEVAGNAIKGFTLVWPVGDDKRRTRALAAMQASFTPTAAILPDVGIADARADLLSGLSIRRPERIRSGFFVSPDGRVVTSAEAVAGCARVTLNDDVAARVAATDAGLGVALLAPAEALVPLSYARLQAGIPRIRSEVAVAGFPYGAALAIPTLTFGVLSDVRGLDGEEQVQRLALAAEDGETGGPVFDTTGSVLGMLLPRATGGSRQLPRDVSFAADAAALATFLSENGVSPAASVSTETVAPEDLGVLAADMTVLVSCWN